MQINHFFIKHCLDQNTTFTLESRILRSMQTLWSVESFLRLPRLLAPSVERNQRNLSKPSTDTRILLPSSLLRPLARDRANRLETLFKNAAHVTCPTFQFRNIFHINFHSHSAHRWICYFRFTLCFTLSPLCLFASTRIRSAWTSRWQLFPKRKITV